MALQRAAGNGAVVQLIGDPADAGAGPIAGAGETASAAGGAAGAAAAAEGAAAAPDPIAEAVRVAALEAHYRGSVTAGAWTAAALDLNAFNDADILTHLQDVSLLTPAALISLDAGIRRVLPSASRLLDPLARLYPESDRVGHLQYDYEMAMAGNQWPQAAILLNGYNDDDIIRKVGELGFMSWSMMMAGATVAQVPRVVSIMSAMAGSTNTVAVNEQVGATVYGVRGSYHWKLEVDAITMEVDMNFIPDAGVSVPTASWFGYITSTWNRFSAVNVDAPGEHRLIRFEPVATGGHDIKVAAGDGRANAGQFYANDSRAAQSIPHEFGHLIGLEDEYERDAADFQRVTGATAPAGAGDTAAATQIATDIHTGLFLPLQPPETYDACKQRRMAAVNQALADGHIAANYQVGESDLTHKVSELYRSTFTNELSTDAAAQVDGPNPFQDWRERTVGTFQYTSTSIMGDMSDHAHPVEPRHVRSFAALVQQGVGHGHWEPRPNP